MPKPGLGFAVISAQTGFPSVQEYLVGVAVAREGLVRVLHLGAARYYADVP